MSEQLRAEVAKMSDEEICTHLIEKYNVDRGVLKSMRGLYLPAGKYSRFPDLECFYEFVLTDDGKFTRQDAIDLYDAMPYEEPDGFWNVVEKTLVLPNTQLLIATCCESELFLDYLYGKLDEAQITSVASILSERLTYWEQIQNFLSHKEDIYDDDFRVISLLCQLGAIPLARVSEEYEMVEQYLEEEV